MANFKERQYVCATHMDKCGKRRGYPNDRLHVDATDVARLDDSTACPCQCVTGTVENGKKKKKAPRQQQTRACTFRKAATCCHQAGLCVICFGRVLRDMLDVRAKLSTNTAERSTKRNPTRQRLTTRQ